MVLRLEFGRDKLWLLWSKVLDGVGDLFRRLRLVRDLIVSQNEWAIEVGLTA